MAASCVLKLHLSTPSQGTGNGKVWVQGEAEAIKTVYLLVSRMGNKGQLWTLHGVQSGEKTHESDVIPL